MQDISKRVRFQVNVHDVWIHVTVIEALMIVRGHGLRNGGPETVSEAKEVIRHLASEMLSDPIDAPIYYTLDTCSLRCIRQPLLKTGS